MTVGETPSKPRPEAILVPGGGAHILSRSYRRGTRLDPHSHRESQLVFAAEGTMQVTTPKGRWLVPPHRAVWVPALLVHAIDVLSPIEMRTVYFDVRWLQRNGGDALGADYVVRVSHLLHESILALFDGRDDQARAGLLLRLILRELVQAEDPATFIPLPQDARCRRAAEMVLTNPELAHDVDNLALACGTSARTLSRLFAAETHLSFKAWCQRARIAAAIEKLAADRRISMKQLAANLGYTSVPAFSHAFRQVTGQTPKSYAEATERLP